MTITVSHQKGGVGKSTIAWNLAVHFSKIVPTTIIDLDIQQSLTQTNEIRKSMELKPLSVKQIKTSDKTSEIFTINETLVSHTKIFFSCKEL